MTSPTTNAVAITGVPAQAHAVAQKHDGYLALEPVECPDLLDWATMIDGATPLKKAHGVLQIAKRCFTLVSDLGAEIAAIERGTPLKPGKGKFAAVRRAVIDLSETGTAAALAALIDRVNEQCTKQGRLYRREAWTELVRSARAFEQAQQETLRKAACARRQVLRSTGRRASMCCVGRPVLIKGLQFTHAIVLNAGACSREELYVALTRGQLSLAVVTAGGELRPKRK
jgi:DNA helicase-2/ATP-dependent DNA helicase PcrA